MADFIYLLQNRLTPAQWRALETVREAARVHGAPVFLVGGAVRDLTTGSPVRDLDFALQGDVEALVPELEAAGVTVAGRNAVLSSLYLVFRGGVRGELGPSLSVSYPKPGQPEAQSAPILDDLRRRDFTANAMAISLNEGSYGLLLDPLNGTADIENRELRLVSPYGFVEQPALLLRAARLSDRLGWSLEERSANRYEAGKEENYIQALPPADRGYELEEIFHEEDPLAALEHMEAEGWRAVLFPHLHPDGDRAGLDHVRDLIGQLEAQGLHPDPSAVFFPMVTAKLSEKDRTALKRLFARQGFVRQIEIIEARAKELGTQLSSKAAALPSESWRLLMDAEPELVLWLAVHVRTGPVQSKIKAFLKDWPQMRQKIPYALMQEMRITPDHPGYDKLLDDLFFALIDGKLDTSESTRAFLEPYSPPAPPQVSVRRRPAKSARSRKRATEDVAPEPVDDLETSDAGTVGSSADQVAEASQSVKPASKPAEPRPPQGGMDVVRTTSSQTDAPKAKEPLPPTSPKKKVEAAKTQSAKAIPSGAGTKRSAVSRAPVKAAPDAKQVAAKKTVPIEVSAKATRTAAPAKQVAGKKAAGAKPVPKAASKVTQRGAAKTTAKKPVKTAFALSRKPAVKTPVKKQTATKAVVKAPSKKIAAKKTVAKKAAAKSTRRTPAKAVKKAAGKRQGSR